MVEAGPDHVSAYALIVEDGTRLAARVRRGELAAPDDDAMADRYLVAERTLGWHGLGWYEISNWAAGVEARCRHNCSTGPAATGGASGRRAQPRRRDPLVERQAPGRVRLASR